MSRSRTSPAGRWPLAPRAAGSELTRGVAHVWCVDLDAPYAATARLYASLTADERDRAARLHFDRDQQRFIVAHGALRDVLAQYLRIPPARIAFVHHPAGKPALGPEFGDTLRFNLSHTDGLALIATAVAADVGVDVEVVRAHRDYDEIARWFFSAAEAEHLASLPRHLYVEGFVRSWTRKEAYLKALGEGLTMPLNAPCVPVTTDSELAEPQAESSDVVQTDRWSFHTLRPAPGYVGTLAIGGGGWSLCRWRWHMPQE